MQKLFGITKVADMIFEKCFEWGARELKHHEKDPNASLSPYFINLRTKDNLTRSGLLTEEDFNIIAAVMENIILLEKLSLSVVAGIPYAGEPFVKAITKGLPKTKVIKLSKKTENGKRKIIPVLGFKYEKGKEVLVIDDLITKADSKFEAIYALESQGMIVKNIVVLIDRQQGGKEELEKAGYNLTSCFTITDLLSYYLQDGRISESKYQECMDYIQNN